jgi:hypothetical protein
MWNCAVMCASSKLKQFNCDFFAKQQRGGHLMWRAELTWRAAVPASDRPTLARQKSIGIVLFLWFVLNDVLAHALGRCSQLSSPQILTLETKCTCHHLCCQLCLQILK